MKNELKQASALILLVLLSGIIACNKNEWEGIEDIRPGFGLNSDSSSYDMVLTKDPNTNTVEYTSLNIHLEFVFDVQMEGVSTAGIQRRLLDENNEVLEMVLDTSLNDISDTLIYDISSVEGLFKNMQFNPDSIRSGYSFLMKAFLVSMDNDTVYAAYGDFQISPEYVNFCDIPDFPLGVYEAHNKASGFKKDVEIQWMEVSPDVWFFVITDFGLDWSNWDDFWYGTNFSLACPPAGDDRFAVELASWGIDLSSMVLEMENDEGVLETRPLRIMPWAYDDDSPDIGYYDANEQQFVFKNVQLKDTWWDIDNHLLDEVTFTYKGK